MSRLESILRWYMDNRGEFETARDEIHDLGPEAKREVLAAALDPAWSGAFNLLVMCLSDVLYPPALPHMRTWMEHRNREAIGIPAMSALDRVAGNRFDVDRFWTESWDDLPATIEAIAAWWDSGGQAEVKSEAEWMAERKAKRASLVAAVPPPAPTITAEQRESLRGETIAMVEAFRALSPSVQHRLEHAALLRVLPIYTAAFPDDATARSALDAVERYLDGANNDAELASLRDQVNAQVSAANAAAGWNAVHQRFQNPGTKAAAHVIQGIWYLCSLEPRNRLQGFHNARDAIDYAGRGLEAVRAELDWQNAQVKAASAA